MAGSLLVVVVLTAAVIELWSVDATGRWEWREMGGAVLEGRGNLIISYGWWEEGEGKVPRVVAGPHP